MMETQACIEQSRLTDVLHVSAQTLYYQGRIKFVHSCLKEVLATAFGRFAELGISDISICGLAKRLEEVWLPESKEPIIFPRHSEGLYLLQRIRDEAHRFAITFHRSKRSKVMLESVLDEIEQLGHIRRAALLDRFGSVSAIRKASLVEIAATPGIGEKIASIIWNHLSHMGESAVIGGVDMQTGEILDK